MDDGVSCLGENPVLSLVVFLESEISSANFAHLAKVEANMLDGGSTGERKEGRPHYDRLCRSVDRIMVMFITKPTAVF